MVNDPCSDCGYSLKLHGQPKLHLPCEKDKEQKEYTAMRAMQEFYIPDPEDIPLSQDEQLDV